MILFAYIVVIGLAIWGVHSLEIPFILGLLNGAGGFLLLHRFYEGHWFNPMMINGMLVTRTEYDKWLNSHISDEDKSKD